MWVIYFGWNFKGILWNSTQNIFPMHWKILQCWNFKSSWIWRAHTCFWKASPTFGTCTGGISVSLKMHCFIQNDTENGRHNRVFVQVYSGEITVFVILTSQKFYLYDLLWFWYTRLLFICLCMSWMPFNTEIYKNMHKWSCVMFSM